MYFYRKVKNLFLILIVMNFFSIMCASRINIQNIYNDYENIIMNNNSHSKKTIPDLLNDLKNIDYQKSKLDLESNKKNHSFNNRIELNNRGILIHVPDDFENIQDAIDYSADGDTILVQPGLYSVDLEYNNKNIVIASNFIFTNNSSDINSTILSHNGAEGAGGIFRIGGDNDDQLVNNGKIIGFTMQDSYVSNIGGAILVMDSYLIVENCIIKDNIVTDSGAGIWVSASDFTLKNSLIYNNHVPNYAGGIGSWDCYECDIITKITVINSTIANNSGGTADENNGYEYSGGVLIGNLFSDSYVEFFSVNNIISFNYPNDISFWTYNQNIEAIIYNSLLTNADYNHHMGDGYDLYESEIIFDDPLFELDLNYHLSSNSPCIDSGTNYFEWEGDILVNMIPEEYIGNAPDMGAFEFGLGCVDSLEVELWGECYNIEETTELYLTDSGLTGPIPPEIGNLINLVHLELDHNQLTGQIPLEIGNLINLNHLSLYVNQLSGQIPLEIWNLTNLNSLVLLDNQLSGQIPSEIGNLVNLEYLYLGFNYFNGSIPSEISNLSNLRELILISNNFSGEILPYITEMENLIFLVLGGNNFSGQIPIEVENLINLEEFNLWGNNFSGDIPIEIGNLVSLQRLWIDGNNFSGQIPESLSNLENIYSINISYNQFSGLIPDSICDLGLDWSQWDNQVTNGLQNNNFCPPYPNCLSEIEIGYQDTSECLDCSNLSGDINNDNILDILDIVFTLNCIFTQSCDSCSDMNNDDIINIQDIILMIGEILDNP